MGLQEDVEPNGSDVSVHKYETLTRCHTTLIRFRRISAYVAISIWVMLIAGIITCLVVYGWNSVLSAITGVADRARESSSMLEASIFFLLISAAVICAIPGMTMVELTCGFVLGFPEAFLVSVISIIAASSVAFLIGRYFLKDALNQYLEREEMHSVQVVLKSIERRNGVFLLTMFRLMLIPLFLKNYGPSAIKTRFQDFFLALCLTTPVYVGFLTYIGSRAKSIADIATGKARGGESSSSISWYELAPLVISLLAALCLGLVAYLEMKTFMTTSESQAQLPFQPVNEEEEGEPLLS